MADNITVNPSTGISVAADFAFDEIASVKHQRVKVQHGADGSATDVSSASPMPVAPISGQVGVAGGAGAVAATVQRVTLASDDPAVVSLAVMDDWDESDRLKVNPIVGQAGVAAGAGVVGATVQRVTLASDDPAVASLSVLDDWDDSDACKVRLDPKTSGGLSIFRSLDLDETEENVKTSAGQIYGWFLANLASGTRHVKIYNETAANTTVGSTTPILTISLPAGAASNVSFPHGIPFDTAICAAATTGVADNDSGAPGANEVVANIFYK